MAARTRGEVLHNHRPGLLLLLVRFVMEEIGVIPVDVRQGEEITLEIAETLAASSLPPDSYRVPAAEWRMVADDRKPVPWNAFPTVAESIADWIEEQAAAHPGRMILLAARMPQEIAMGLGIQLGQRSTTWPHRLYPVHHVGGQRLVVPDLDLGRDSVRAERMVET